MGNVDINEVNAFRSDYSEFKDSLNRKLDRLLVAVMGTEEQPNMGLLKRMEKMERKDDEQDLRLAAIEATQARLQELVESDKGQERRIAVIEQWITEQRTLKKAETLNSAKLRGWREVAAWIIGIVIALATLANMLVSLLQRAVI